MGQRIPVTLGNIAPLASKAFRPGKLAIVCEGGGQRGIFTAGVLDEFMRANFNPFDLFLGTSAGAQNLSAYVCHQHGHARRVITRFTTTREFFDPLRFVRGGHLIDLDWLVEATSAKIPLSMSTGEKLFESGKAFYMCACRSDDYTPGYFSPNSTSWLNILKASSAIPGFYRSGVEIDGIGYQDGGISDAIPVREAVRLGAETLVVIRTVPSQVSYTPEWFKRMERWLGDSSLQPLLNLVHHHEASYREIQDFIENPPGKLRIFEIYPPKPLMSMALGSRIPALNTDYQTGLLCGRYFLATVGRLLATKPPITRHHPRIVVPGTVVVAPTVITQEPISQAVIETPEANDSTFNNEGTA